MASENVTKAVSLKDYIIDMKSATVKGGTQYEVVLENNTDFIVRRQTATTCRELVILVSKGLYYIKDCKTGHIEELKEQTLNSFLRELKDGMIALNQVHWLSNLYRESVGLIMQVITDETLTDMMTRSTADMTAPFSPCSSSMGVNDGRVPSPHSQHELATFSPRAARSALTGLADSTSILFFWKASSASPSSPPGR